MKTFGVFPLVLSFCLACLWSAEANAQTALSALLEQTDQLRSTAEQNAAPLLAPATFQEAEKLFTAARDDVQKQKSPERIRERLDRASATFNLATAQAMAASEFFTQTLNSRSAATAADAERFADREWKAAEKQFRDAIKAYERDKIEAAQRDGVSATEQYRRAELTALRNVILSPARDTLADIRRSKLDKWVPLTMASAEMLLQQADALIIAERSNLEAPRKLAAQAETEATRAQAIAQLAEQVDRKDSSVEQLLLRWQNLLTDIRVAAGVAAEPGAPPEEAAAAIIAELEQIPGLRSDLADRDALVVDLEGEIRELDAKLGGASDDRTRLIRRLEQQARVREQFAQVETLFAPEEAVVLRDGGNLLIRLVGMRFASNSATLTEEGIALLDKVRAAIDVFPQCDLTVEGHTDSSGNAERNLTLSQDRALAVKTHMIDEMRIPAFRIESVGYGDTRPVASNRTAEGRIRNRRIDLIIVPNAASF